LKNAVHFQIIEVLPVFNIQPAEINKLDLLVAFQKGMLLFEIIRELRSDEILNLSVS
jgi:hypothetical protein